MERFRPPHGDLFQKGDVNYLEEALKESARKKIHDLTDDYILNVSEQEYIDYLSDVFYLDCPVVMYDDMSIEPRTVLVSPEYLPSRWFYYDAHEIERKVYRLFIPYQGDGELLKYKPNPYSTGCWPNISISNDSLYVDILDINGDANDVKRECNSYMNTLRDMMSYLEKNYAFINRCLPDNIRSMFTIRKNQIKKEHQELVDIGIPIKGQNNNKTYSIPTVQRRYKSIPKVINTIPERVTPTMADKEYREIISSLNIIGRNLERFPNTHRDRDEETIRDLFLTQLVTSFTNYSSTGEAFNHRGKTDIMVKKGDDILFIAECKFWKGAKVLTDAISQLLSYLTWRDTKTALLIFNREVGMSAVIKSLQETIPQHPNYVSGIKKSETQYDYVFHLNNDKSRQIMMSVLIFDFQ